eukprot:s1883_g2.t1
MAAPRAAATILVLAEAPGEAMKVLMIKRHSRARFMANTYVFPGRCVDDADREHASKLPSAETLAEYRETGVHLDSDGTAGVGSAAPALGAAQVARLTPFAHWVTPKQEKYRYDTRFFLTQAANSAAAALAVRGDPKEVDDVRWDSNFRLPPPTFLIMQSLVLTSQPKGAAGLLSKYAGLYGSSEGVKKKAPSSGSEDARSAAPSSRRSEKRRWLHSSDREVEFTAAMLDGMNTGPPWRRIVYTLHQPWVNADVHLFTIGKDRKVIDWSKQFIDLLISMLSEPELQQKSRP